MIKSSFISIIGRPSSGKSTLVNSICGSKISICSPVPQTTRNKIKGIFSEDRGQLIFIDTPGFHNSEKQFNKKMVSLIYEAIEESSLILYLLDSTKEIKEEEEILLNLVKKTDKPIVLVFNKIDLKNNIQTTLEKEIKEKYLIEKQLNLISISAKKKLNLDNLLNILFEISEEGELYYPADYVSDASNSFIIKEIIREKAINLVRDEIPHAIFIQIEDIEKDKSKDSNFIRASLIVQSKSQKAILIGKGGEMIKKIRSQSQKEIKKFIYKNYLDLHVKVNPKWKSQDNIIF